METGFWRPQADSSLEVVMCHPAGYAEVWYGKITGAKIELATDAVVRTSSADDYQRASGSTAMSTATCCGPSTRLMAASAVPPVGPAPPRLIELRMSWSGDCLPCEYGKNRDRER